MFSLVLRGSIFLIFMFWYTLTVWNLIDEHFNEEFRKYLTEEQDKENDKPEETLAENSHQEMRDVCKMNSKQLTKDKYLVTHDDACFILEDKND